MNRRLYHPWWVHLPAAACLVVACVALVAAPRGTLLPMRYDWQGKVTAWATPARAVLPLLMALVYLALGVLGDELWARAEYHCKRFNWFSPLDELVVGLMSGFAIAGVIRPTAADDAVPIVVALPVAAALLAALLEHFRPWRSPPAESIQDVGDLGERLAEYIRAGREWTYVEVQDPLYVRLLALLLDVPVIIWMGLLLALTRMWQPAVVMLVLLSLLPLMYGGLQFRVDGRAVEVRMGVLAVRLKRIPLGMVEHIAVEQFSPMADYGGWGVRYARKTWAFFYRGQRGVKLRLRNGKQYLLGSDTPDRLAIVIEQARGGVAALSGQPGT